MWESIATEFDFNLFFIRLFFYLSHMRINIDRVQAIGIELTELYHTLLENWQKPARDANQYLVVHD